MTKPKYKKGQIVLLKHHVFGDITEGRITWVEPDVEFKSLPSWGIKRKHRLYKIETVAGAPFRYWKREVPENEIIGLRK